MASTTDTDTGRATKVFEFSLKDGAKQKWFIVVAKDEAAALSYARARADKLRAEIYCGPKQAECRWCTSPAVTLVGKPTPWAKVCEDHAENPPFWRT